MRYVRHISLLATLIKQQQYTGNTECLKSIMRRGKSRVKCVLVIKEINFVVHTLKFVVSLVALFQVD